MCRIMGLVLLAVVISHVHAQSSGDNSAFSVASVKRITPGRPAPFGVIENDHRVSYTHIPLFFLVLRAYEIESYQLIGLRPNVGEDVYDVMANLPGGSSKKQIPAMLRQLLETRFHLVAHWEPRETRMFVLRVADGGLLLKPSPAPPDDSPERTVRAMTNPATGRTHLQDSMTLARLAKFLSGIMRRTDGRPVLDKTGIEGEFDILLDARLPVDGATSMEDSAKDLRLPDGKSQATHPTSSRLSES